MVNVDVNLIVKVLCCIFLPPLGVFLVRRERERVSHAVSFFSIAEFQRTLLFALPNYPIRFADLNQKIVILFDPGKKEVEICGLWFEMRPTDRERQLDDKEKTLRVACRSRRLD